MAASVQLIELKAPINASPRRHVGAERPLLPHFYAGPENRLVAFVCGTRQGIADRGNPLLLTGPSGCGKSALAATVAANETESCTAAKVLHFKAVDFARRYAEGVDGDDLDHFRKPVSEADVLWIDDVHLIADKGPAQEELAARLADRFERSRVTILTCRRLPSEIRGFRPLLSSRMLPGLTIQVSPPGGDARRELLRALADDAEFSVDDELLDLLAAGLPAGLPTPRLAAAISHLRLWCRNAESSPTAAAIQSAIDAASSAHAPTIPAIAGAVARRFKLKTADLKGPTRRQQVVRARALAMFLGRQLTDRSLQQIGDYFGGRDHTTVLHACRKTESLLGNSPDLSRAADEVTEALRSSA